MKSEGLLFFSDHFLLVIGLVVFISLFVIILIQSSSRSQRQLHRKMAQLPVLDEQGEIK